jgi:hypothetical protein
VEQVAIRHRQVVSRVRDRAYASARGQLDGDVALRRAAIDAAGRLDSPDEAASATGVQRLTVPTT